MKHGLQPTLTLTQLLDEFHVFAASVIGSLPALLSRRCRHAWTTLFQNPSVKMQPKLHAYIIRLSN